MTIFMISSSFNHQIYIQSITSIELLLYLHFNPMTQQPEPLLHYTQGKSDSKSLLVFLQGWPDNHLMWDWINWKDELASHHRLLFIDFPNTSSDKPQIKWGQDFPIIISRLRATLEKFDSYQSKILIAHDWGCVYGYLFDKTFPKYFNQIIAMDVPAYTHLSTLSQVLYVMAYQLYLIVAFLIGGPIGRIMTQTLVKIFKHNPPYTEQITAARNYPYFYFHKNKIQSIMNKEKNMLYKYVPSVPVVYLYAKKKPFQFHGQKWLNYLANTPNCQVHGFDAGHWFMKKYNKFIIELINRRAFPKL